MLVKLMFTFTVGVVTKMAKRKEIEYPPIVRDYPSVTRKAWLKARNSNSRKYSIRAMCLLCCGGSGQEVQLCTQPDCPLYKFRITG